MYCKIICIGILWEPCLDSQYVFNGADSVNLREAKTKTTAEKKYGNDKSEDSCGGVLCKKTIALDK